MSIGILVIGESGTGKSTSFRNLPPAETFIINVIGKHLPFRGANKLYTKLSPDGKTGNYYATDNHVNIMKAIANVNMRRPEIKYLVIDDFGYTISNSFMRKCNIKGYDKYAEIGKDAFDVMDLVNNLRDDLFCIVVMHTDIDAQGKYKPKTVGKMIDQYICIEGKFTYVLHTIVSEGNYSFLTNNDGQHMAKTPMGMFDKLYVPNDLKSVTEEITTYFNQDVEM